jgi:hypothetical protein
MRRAVANATIPATVLRAGRAGRAHDRRPRRAERGECRTGRRARRRPSARRNLWPEIRDQVAARNRAAQVEPLRGLHGIGVHNGMARVCAHERNDVGRAADAHRFVVDAHHGDDGSGFVDCGAQAIEIDNARGRCRYSQVAESLRAESSAAPSTALCSIPVVTTNRRAQGRPRARPRPRPSPRGCRPRCRRR